MFDVTSRLTYKNVPTWHRDLCRWLLFDARLLFDVQLLEPEAASGSKDLPPHDKRLSVRGLRGSSTACSTMMAVSVALWTGHPADRFTLFPSRVCESIPIVLCGNKVDVKNRQVKPKQVWC
jgi:hypothetical protein